MSAKGKTALKAFFNTGDVPTESQFADFIDSYQNISDENFFIGSNPNLEGVVPSVQGTAAVLDKLSTSCYNGDTAAAGFKLPLALPGRVLYVSVVSLSQNDFYPATGEYFNGKDLNLPVSFLGAKNVIFFCTEVNMWSWVVTDVPSLTTLLAEFFVNLTQTGTSAPSMAILSNNAGSVTSTRTSTGIYNLLFNDITFDPAKVGVIINNTFPTEFFGAGVTDGNNIFIATYSNLGVVSDNILANTTLKISIYA